MNRELQVEEIFLHELKQDPNNARTHDERNLASIRMSIAAHGQVQPLLVQKSTNQIIAGNGRHLAMAALGMTKAKVLFIDCDNKERDRLSVRLNRSAELAGWDTEQLSDFLSEWKEQDGEAWDAESFGWSDSEVNALHNAAAPPTWEDVWNNEVEFEQDDLGAVRSITIKFEEVVHVAQLAKRLGLTITDQTKSVWYPPRKNRDFTDQEWKAEE